MEIGCSDTAAWKALSGPNSSKVNKSENSSYGITKTVLLLVLALGASMGACTSVCCSSEKSGGELF
eukprot:8937106-Ditylum_brightwellii.AAC.1